MKKITAQAIALLSFLTFMGMVMSATEFRPVINPTIGIRIADGITDVICFLVLAVAIVAGIVAVAESLRENKWLGRHKSRQY